MKLNSNAIDLGNRAKPDSPSLTRWTSMGVAMDRSVVVADFAGVEKDVHLLFWNKSQALRDAVDTYLNVTVKNGGTADVTLDSGDDLGIQALGVSGGTASLVYVPNSFRFTHTTGTKFNLEFTLRYYA